MGNLNFKTKRSRKKTFSAVLILLLAGALICGSLFAFFSDKLEGGGIIVAGDLKIEGGAPDKSAYIIERYIGAPNDTTQFDSKESIYWEPYDMEDPSSCVLNPGDILRVKTSVKNIGTKSAWLGGEIFVSLTLNADSDTLNEMKDHVKVYTNTYQGTGTGTLLFDLSVDGEGKKASTKAILDGKLESEQGVDSFTPILFDNYCEEVVGYIVFEDAANNHAQSGKIEITVTMKAVQFRHNTEFGSQPKWDAVTEDGYDPS